MISVRLVMVMIVADILCMFLFVLFYMLVHQSKGYGLRCVVNMDVLTFIYVIVTQKFLLQVE